MKKLVLVIITVLAVSAINCFSLYKVAVQNGDVVTFYATLQAAIDAAPSGSDIYIPGTGYTTINLSKKLNFYGTGYYPSETDASGVSFIESFILKTGADSSTFCGISFSSVTIQNNLKNIFFKRCRIPNILYNTLTNSFFTECYLNSFSTNLSDCMIQKCLIQGQFGNTTQDCIFNNNIFMTNYLFSSASGNTIVNSIFAYAFNAPGVGNFYQNNLFVPNITDFGNNTAKNNLVNKALSTIFVNVGSGNTFSYNYDYHLKSDSPGKNYGTDSTDVGIYGTDNPYKENAVPEIPHITKSIIPLKTSNGNLPVEIQVESQTK
jgi:hypothetical protein